MSKFASEITIDGKKIGANHPTYFIADVAANHDGDLQRAIDLIYLAKECGADAAKFQHFKASSIVSDYGFKNLQHNNSHQASWKKSVFEVYQDASLNPDWTGILKETCDKAGITFFTSPYSFELIEEVDKYVPAYKVGSGDITWPQIIQYMAKKGKPMLLACGASTMEEVKVAVQAATEITSNVLLMQCNTNYTASLENFKFINLNVLNSFKQQFPGMLLGLSDHTPGHASVLGAVTLGARAVEKHFTDSNERNGPDHKFAMNPQSWREMVERTREIEYSLGDGVKVVEENEKETVILQRRSIRLTREIKEGETIQASDLEVLRPCPVDAFAPYQIQSVIGKKVKRSIPKGDYVKVSDV
jgi:sialic acid synthase SpsE